jgi:hypothetical protein
MTPYRRVQYYIKYLYPSINNYFQTSSGARKASSPMGTGGPFPGGKARPGRDADHSPQYSTEVVNE